MQMDIVKSSASLQDGKRFGSDRRDRSLYRRSFRGGGNKHRKYHQVYLPVEEKEWAYGSEESPMVFESPDC